MPVILDFWYEFASTYSYLSALRIEALAEPRGIAVRWRPFLLGPIFQAQGWTTSPFNLYPAKGRYMVRDIERIAESRGLEFRLPDPFPQTSLPAARVATAIAHTATRAAFTRAVYLAEFRDGRPIDEPAVLAACLAEAGVEPESVLAAAGSDAVKANLRAETAEAQRLGLFGAPSFVTADGELFWGDDRLEAAVAWAAGTH